MLQELCTTYTNLTAADITQLEIVNASLPLIASLTGADVFLDCLCREGQDAMVVAEAKPLGGRGSAYIREVAGQKALSINEPAVFHAFASGMPVRDLKAITQESVSVKQDVVPIKNAAGVVIAVLIKEKDVSEYILQDKKYEELAKTKMSFDGSAAAPDDLAMREVNHRIKNNLQTIASILNMQARRAKNGEMRDAFKENVSRVLSIASIHDILSANASGEIEIKTLLDKIRRNIQSTLTAAEPPVITVTGDVLTLPSDKASAVALCVNELMMNAAEHAFPDGMGGTITVLVQNGTLYCTITVIDTGVGFSLEAAEGRMGLDIVNATVKGKLKGELKILSDSGGTKAMIEFRK